MHLTNKSSLPISLVDAGIYVRKRNKQYKISFEENGFKIHPSPITLNANTSLTITTLIDMRNSSQGTDERFYSALYNCMLSKVNPFTEKQNPKIFLYVKSTDGKIFKRFIGTISEIITRANDK